MYEHLKVVMIEAQIMLTGISSLISQKLRMLAALFSMEVLFFSIIALAVLTCSPQLFLFSMVLTVCRAVFRLTIAVASLSGFGIRGRVSFLRFNNGNLQTINLWSAQKYMRYIGSILRNVQTIFRNLGVNGVTTSALLFKISGEQQWKDETLHHTNKALVSTNYHDGTNGTC